MRSKKSTKAVVTLVGDEQQLSRRAAERWTLREAASELSEQSSAVMSPNEWLALLRKLVPAELLQSHDGEVLADDVNALLDAHPHWRGSTPRLPSARQATLHEVGWFDYSMHAAHWFDMVAPTPREAASILSQSDPLDESADPDNVTNDETGPDDFRLLLRVFSDVERSSPGCRTLLEWLKIAEVRGCKHHSWISKYLEGREKLAALEQQSTAPAVFQFTDHEAGAITTTKSTQADRDKKLEKKRERQSRGYFTMSEVAQILADTYSNLNAVELLKKMKADYHAGKITVRSGDTDAPVLSDHTLREFSDWMFPDDIRAMLKHWGWSRTFPFPATGAAPVLPAGASDGMSDVDTAPAKPLQRTAAQDAAILCEIEKQGFDPLALPKNQSGKPGVKAAIRGAVNVNKLFVGTTIFNKAWERLTTNGEIVIQD